MIKLLSNNKFRIAVILLIVLIVAGVSIYRSKNTKLLDKEAYSGFRSTIEEFAGDFSCQQDLMDFIESSHVGPKFIKKDRLLGLRV